MSENKTAYPLSWPIGWKRTILPERSRFGKFNSKPTVERAKEKLNHELYLLAGETEYVLSTNIKLRIDGLPYSGMSEPKDAGVAIYFTYNKQDMVIACDNFDKVGCNIYAIAMTIEAMRGIERWGCSELMRRAFTGFKALPETASNSSWMQVLGLAINATPDVIKERYRILSKQYHPDIPGGDAEKFVQVKAAYEDAMKQFIR